MNKKTGFQEAMAHRHSHYALSDKSPVSDAEIQGILEFALANAPSAFNSQSTRLVLLLGDEHKKLWNIVKEVLKARISEKAFAATKEKIENCFESGYGSVLFFEETNTIKNLQENFPSYKGKFPAWSQHTCAIHQFAIWTMLEDKGFGASLQHYNPVIDDKVKAEWTLPESWELVAQMPFGQAVSQPAAQKKLPFTETLKIFKS